VLEDFRKIYVGHVENAAAGRREATVADVLPASLPRLHEGVAGPRGAIEAYDIIDVRADGDRRIGETVYWTADGAVGLRSVWERHGGRCLVVRLENFPVVT
jgi:hypothetical protein